MLLVTASAGISSRWRLVISLFPNLERSKVLMAVINFWFKCASWSLLLVWNSHLTWRPCLSRALIEKTPQEWNSLLPLDLTMFQRWLLLCVAILTKLIQQITHHNQLSVLLGQHDFNNNFYNLNRLIFQKRWLYTSVSRQQKEIFPLKKNILGLKSTAGKAAFQSNFKF